MLLSSLQYGHLLIKNILYKNNAMQFLLKSPINSSSWFAIVDETKFEKKNDDVCRYMSSSLLYLHLYSAAKSKRFHIQGN